MTSDPLFSILMPTHGRADVIGTAIASVLGQTLGEFELLIAGDGCADGTADVIAAFDDPRIRWFDWPKGEGRGYANRNAALREARGRLVAFAAHDDILLADHLELLAAPFGDARVGWAYSRPLWIDDAGTVVPFFVNLHDPSHQRAFLSERNVLPATCVVYRRAMFDAAPWPEEVARSGDWVMWRRMVEALLERGDPHAIGHVRHPTCLHFRADWRPGDAWGPPPLTRTLDAVAQRPGAWPSALFVPRDAETPNDAPPQHHVMAAMRDDPAFAGRLRGGVALLQDTIAWSAMAAASFDLRG